MPKLEDLTGRQFGRLTVLSYAGKQKWLCRCECGTEKAVHAGALKSGRTKSCGCLNPQHFKVCAECGKRFPCPPSDKTITCSAACKSKRRSRLLQGHEVTKQTASAMSATAKAAIAAGTRSTAPLQKGTPAAQKSPKGGRFVTNASAKRFRLVSPDGIVYECTNLMEFIRKHGNLFGINGANDDEVKRVHANFIQLKGGLRRKANRATCNGGWTLILEPDSSDLRNCDR